VNQIICFYKRYKSAFITFHSSIYDLPFNCNSHIISFIENNNNVIQYGNVIIFLSIDDGIFAIIQKYVSCEKHMSNYVEVPSELHRSINIFFPIVSLSNNFTIVPVSNIRHKCIRVPIFDSFCVSEIRIDYEHDWSHSELFKNLFLFNFLTFFKLLFIMHWLFLISDNNNDWNKYIY
jgi:hypothetical protein